MASSSELWIREYNEASKHTYDSTRMISERSSFGTGRKHRDIGPPTKNTLNMSRKKVTNATEAVCKYISDDFPNKNPWHGIDEEALKDEVRNIIKTTLGQQEREIIYLYYGLDNEYLTWEDISRRVGG
ncbi:RNA polymerase sigma factor sigA-like protein [Tanacetum coccineum]